VPIDTLVSRLQAITGSNPDAVLYVRGDKDINYGKVLEVMSLISNAGFHKVSLVAEAPKGGGSSAPPAGQGSAPARAGAH
jgi:biopolymer transport protein TolR